MTKLASKSESRPITEEGDFLQIKSIDHLHFYVGNAKQAAHFYQSALGFQPVAYSGPETGVRERASYVVRQNKITFVLTTPLRATHAFADHILKHGDGVKAIALKVKDATSAWKETTKRGGKSYMEPKTLTDKHGKIVLSGIHTLLWLPRALKMRRERKARFERPADFHVDSGQQQRWFERERMSFAEQLAVDGQRFFEVL